MKNVKPFKIELTKIKGYSFEGYIYDHYLSADQLKTLGLPTNSPEMLEIQVIGDFTVQWDDGIPMVEIESVIALGAKNGETINIQTGYIRTKSATGFECLAPKYEDVPATYVLDLEPDVDYNLEDLTEQLERSGNDIDWLADRQAALADYWHDRYKDGD